MLEQGVLRIKGTEQNKVRSERTEPAGKPIRLQARVREIEEFEVIRLKMRCLANHRSDVEQAQGRNDVPRGRRPDQEDADRAWPPHEPAPFHVHVRQTMLGLSNMRQSASSKRRLSCSTRAQPECPDGLANRSLSGPRCRAVKPVRAGPRGLVTRRRVALLTRGRLRTRRSGIECRRPFVRPP